MGYRYILEKGFIKDLNKMVGDSLIENLERTGMIQGHLYIPRGSIVLSRINDITNRVECRHLDGISYGKELIKWIKDEIKNKSSIGTIHTHIIEYDNITWGEPMKGDKEFLKEVGGILVNGSWSPYNHGKYGDFRISRLDNEEILTEKITISLNLTKKALKAGNKLDKDYGALSDPWD